MSTILGISSTNWLTIWIILEINVLCMCYIIANNSKINKKRETSTFLYYLIQVILSMLIITWVFYTTKENTIVSILITIAILRKTGMWPLHGWYIKLISRLEIKQRSIIIIITWQKILPITLVTTLQLQQSVINAVIIIILGTILASLARLTKNLEIKKIMAISSINNNSWILIRRIVSIRCIFTFLTIYSITLVITLRIIEKIIEKSKSTIKNFWINTIIVRNLSGLPPLAIFWAKITVIKTIIKRNIPSEIALTLILSACLLIYHYLWITINEISATPEKSQIVIKTRKENKIKMILIITRIIRALTFLTSGLTKRVYLDRIKFL